MIEELSDRRGDLITVGLKRKMAGVKEAYICVLAYRV
jgi:hypothetical protein